MDRVASGNRQKLQNEPCPDNHLHVRLEVESINPDIAQRLKLLDYASRCREKLKESVPLPQRQARGHESMHAVTQAEIEYLIMLRPS